MPCTGGGPSYIDESELESVEKKLCRARWVLLKLTKHLNSKTPNWLAKYIAKEKREQLKHRLEDKKSANEIVREELDEIIQNIKDITRLGGIPSKTVLNRKRRLSKELTEIKQISDADLMESSWCDPVTVVDRILKRK